MRRSSFKERCSFSRRASDTSSAMWNSSYQSHLERLYNQTMTQSSTQQLDEENLTTSSLQELHQLQKQLQKVKRKSVVKRNEGKQFFPSRANDDRSVLQIRRHRANRSVCIPFVKNNNLSAQMSYLTSPIPRNCLYSHMKYASLIFSVNKGETMTHVRLAQFARFSSARSSTCV